MGALCHGGGLCICVLSNYFDCSSLGCDATSFGTTLATFRRVMLLHCAQDIIGAVHIHQPHGVSFREVAVYICLVAVAKPPKYKITNYSQKVIKVMLRLLNLGGWAPGIRLIGCRTPSVFSYLRSHEEKSQRLCGVLNSVSTGQSRRNPGEFVTMDP